MRRTIFLSSILLLVGLLCEAQTATFIGGGGDNRWRTPANWDTGVVPGPSNDVILPNGSSSEIFGLTQTLRVKSITMQGNAVLTVLGHWGIDEASSVGTGATVNWNAGTLSGPGVLTNNGTIEHATVTAKIIDQTGSLQNNGSYELAPGSGDFLIEGLFVNGTNGTVTSAASAQNINSTTNVGVLRNLGTLNITGTLNLLVSFENEDGTVNVNSGVCILNDPNSKLEDGEYNVASGAEMRWIGGTTALEGNLTGTLNGPLNWFGNVSVSNEASFDFGGNEKVYWKDNNLLGGGTLTILSDFEIESANDGIVGNTTLRNETDLTLASVLQVVNGVFLNAPSGTIQVQTGGGFSTSGTATTRTVINEGAIFKMATGTNTVSSVLFQNNGLLQIESGILSVNSSLGFENLTEGIVSGAGTLTITANTPLTNNGTFAPGNSPGILTYNGTFDSESQAVLEVELDGLVQGTEYDLLEIIGDADFQGTVRPILNFAPSVNDEFIIASTTGTITNCNVPASVTATFGGFAYTFLVTCRNDTEVVLTTDSIVLGTASPTLEEALLLYPNPVLEWLHISVPSHVAIESVELFSIDGRRIVSNTIMDRTNLLKLPMSTIPQGMYLVSIETSAGSVSKKIIKK
jgi:hypothetical protein